VPTVTPWNLPKSLLEALPESAGALARLAAEAYDVDPGTVDSGGDRRAEQHQVRRPPQSLVDLAEESSPHAERVASLIGMRLQVEFSSYRVMEEMRHEVLVPAIDAGEGQLLSRCCSFKRRSTAQGLALRARIVLACAQGGSNLAVAARLGVNRGTVSKWRARFLRDRLDGLPDEPRPGVPRTITDAQVEEVVVRTLEEVPEGATHWSKRELARQVGISPTSVHRIWRAFGLQPWRTETFKISPDPLLIDKIRDVVGLCLAPPANAVVFSVDEKPQTARTAPAAPRTRPGRPAR